MEQKIKQNGIDIGGNIRRIRLEKGCGQTELVRMLQLKNIDITRETLVKIERGIQTEPETKNPPKQTEPSKPVKPVSRKLTVKVKNVTYNGKAQKPAVTVYAGKKKLSSKYYAVSYKKNKNVGYGTVVVKGKGRYGKYSGTAAFKINLKKTKLSSAKSTKRKTFTTTWKKTGGNSGWQVQYSLNKKFRSGVRTVNLKANNTKLTVRKLRSRKNYYVRIRSYKKVGKQTWYSDWSNVKRVRIK